MRTVRRLYFYALALVSVEVALWGSVNLLRTALSSQQFGAAPSLATGLSFTLVGIPIFVLTWRSIQNEAARDSEERASRIRAIFFYAALCAFQFPILYATLALLNRILQAALGLPEAGAVFGGSQTLLDNLVAIAANLAAMLYFTTRLRDDWLARARGHFLAETRRFYRYLWSLVGLVMTALAARNLIWLILLARDGLAFGAVLSSTLALAAVGAAVWAWSWLHTQAALDDADERRSLLRRVVLFGVSLVGLLGFAAQAGGTLTELLHRLLGMNAISEPLWDALSSRFAGAVVFGVIWAYHGRILSAEIEGVPSSLFRASLLRLYRSLVSLPGLGLTYAGAASLWSLVAGALTGETPPPRLLAETLAVTLVGVWLWLRSWPALHAEAVRPDDLGDHARRSVVRKVYLYLALFTAVVGCMGFAVAFFYTLINRALGNIQPDFATQALRHLGWFGVTLTFLLYHWREQRADSRAAQHTLRGRYADFSVAVFAAEEDAFAPLFVNAARRQAEGMPVEILPLAAIPQSAPRAVVLPAGLALDPPAALRDWLRDYAGQRLVLPQALERWTWLGVDAPASDGELAEAAALAARQMAEGELVRPPLTSNPWMIAAYVLAAIFGVLLLAAMFSLLLASFS